MHKFEKCYVDKLPNACVGCPFLGVDNKLWVGVEKGYVSTQWCNLTREHLEERLFESRDKDCPLKLIEENNQPPLIDEPPIYDYPLEDSIPPNENNINWKDRFDFDSLNIESQLSYVLKNYKRQIEENVLYDILMRFYFADWTRACDYEKMTPEEVVNAAMSVCKDIEKAWDYNLDDDIMPMCGSMSFDFDEDIID
jgi:hypothetical protein